MNTAALFTVVKIQKQSKCLPTDEWIEKMGYVYVCLYICIFKVIAVIRQNLCPYGTSSSVKGD